MSGVDGRVDIAQPRLSWHLRRSGSGIVTDRPKAWVYYALHRETLEEAEAWLRSSSRRAPPPNTVVVVLLSFFCICYIKKLDPRRRS